MNASFLLCIFKILFSCSSHITAIMSKSLAMQMMESYVQRTGAAASATTPGLPRYLWTDSFAVTNFLALQKPDSTQAIIQHVHQVLARQRSERYPGKYLDGASDDHPTLGGLRIGKKLDERQPSDPYDRDLEWDRDGQYFHYLTKWMWALDHAARCLHQPSLNLWARELAATAHRTFTYGGRHKRMYWKMSVDLSRPLVESQGHHDPLDGLITAMQLQETARQMGGQETGPGLEEVVRDYLEMVQDGQFTTTDALGLGGLLVDAGRVEELIRRGRQEISAGTSGLRIATTSALLDRLLSCSLSGLKAFAHREFDEKESANYRLAFRELGLAIGMNVVKALREGSQFAGSDAAKKALYDIAAFDYVRERIVGFWTQDANRKGKTYTEHRDINDVMLATAMLDGVVAASERKREEL